MGTNPRGGVPESDMTTAVPTIKLPSGDTIPVLGLGAWMMGESARSKKDEVAALRLGLDLGMKLIDTAELYASGGSEQVVGGGDRGTARRGVPREQGDAAQRDQERHDRRLRAEPASA